MVFRPRVQDFLDHFPQLIDLDREHAAVRLLIAGFRDCAVERLANGVDPVPQQILEADHQRKPEALLARFLDDGHDIDCRALVLERRDLEVAA